VRDAAAHRRAMTAAASYLPAEQGDERDPSHLVPELSRRARGFATWATLRHLGREGIAEMVARHCAIAHGMAERLKEEPGITVENEVCLNQVIVGFGTGDAPAERDRHTETVIQRLQDEGVCFVGGARWRDRLVMRISVISGPTTERDGERSAAAIIDAWRKVRA
jgi:glutamate/tyrosine decarboxylase-like PLP-dependent enzyme